ncbi:7-carboxy-7-deazaguanine synthase [uncultured archaeon]|nr:7-carboxy-7-deazaguanine synthase [uncultured archaeon]
MFWHILMTEICNSECKYCYEKSMQEFDNGLEKKWKFDFSAPRDFSVDIEKIKKFILQDKDPVIIFYGGEPLLQLEKIKQIMDSFKNTKVKFCMQTNGKLLDKIPEKYLNKFSKILVSIDGDRQRTDFNRGKGTYDLVLNNLKLIRKDNFHGEIVARMCLSPLPKRQIDVSDIDKQIKHLLSLNVFDSVHWQIDAGFYKKDYNKKDFADFAKKYDRSLSNLLDFWISEMKEGKVRRIYPFVGIFESIYYSKKTKLRCGAGFEGYAITTDGKITTCPIMNNITDFYCGHVEDSTPTKLKQIPVESPCTECSYLNLCGGRCLYSNKAKLWPEEGQAQICETVIFLIEELKKRIPEIKKLIKEGKIKESDFEYQKYFGPEIIP